MSGHDQRTAMRETVIEPPPGPHAPPEPAQTLPAEAARQGSTPGVVRWVLLCSLALVVVAMIIAFVAS